MLKACFPPRPPHHHPTSPSTGWAWPGIKQAFCSEVATYFYQRWNAALQLFPMPLHGNQTSVPSIPEPSFPLLHLNPGQGAPYEDKVAEIKTRY